MLCDRPPSDINDVTGFHDSSGDDVIADVINVIRRRSLFDALVTSTVSTAVSRSTVTLTLCQLSSFKPETVSRHSLNIQIIHQRLHRPGASNPPLWVGDQPPTFLNLSLQIRGEAPKAPSIEAQRAEAWVGFLGRGLAAPSPRAKGFGGAL